MHRSTPLPRDLVALAIVVLAVLLASAMPAHAAPGWFSGTGAYQSGTQCFGGTTTGYGANTQTSVSYWTDPDAGYPAVGDKYWMRILTGAVGFTCPWGISDIALEMIPPDGTGLAIDLASTNPDDKVRCFYQGSGGAVTEVTNMTWTAPWDATVKGKWCDSTKLPGTGTYGWSLGQRLLAQGTMFWVTVPVRSFQALKGMAGAGNTTKVMAPTSSGVNTFANPYQWVTVADRPAAVGYPADATSAITETTVRTKAVLDAWYRKGNVYVELGTGTSGAYDAVAGPIAIDGAWPQYTVTQDWTQLTPGTDHHWRLRFVDDKGVTTVGPAKTFRTAGTAPSGGSTGGPVAGGGGTTGGSTGGSTGGTTGGGTTTGGTTAGGGDTSGGSSAPASTPAPAADAQVKPADPAPVAAAVTPEVLPAGDLRFALAPGTGLRALAGKGGTVSVGCAKACKVRAALKVDAATAKRLGLGRRTLTLATGSATSTKGGSVAVRVRASGAAARALKKARSVKATLVVTLDGGASRTARVTLKR
ncbi:MAG: hypothetical protein HZB46_11615 [Solirubrobacterales bacterium]|nr:hypothetical protein [Solirubrobacterales bacterium]